MCTVPQMRTADQVYAAIKAQDPDTALSLRYIRRLVHEQKVPVTSVGTKKLVDLAGVLEYIARGDQSESEAMDTEQVPRISRVSE